MVFSSTELKTGGGGDVGVGDGFNTSTMMMTTTTPPHSARNDRLLVQKPPPSPPTSSPPAAAVVGGDAGADGVVMSPLSRGGNAGSPPTRLLGTGPTRVGNTFSRSITSLATVAHLPIPPHGSPSPMLRAIVNSVAFSRDAESPSIPPEVIIAFDEYISEGTQLMEFPAKGNPTHHFFAVKFINLYEVNDELIPEVVFGWKASKSVTRFRSYYLLSNLVDVVGRGVKDHPHVARYRLASSGQLQYATFLKKHRLRDDCIFKLTFRDELEEVEEDIILKAPNAILYYSWLVFMEFISSIGTASPLTGDDDYTEI